MKRDEEYRQGYLAGWQHAGGTQVPKVPSTPSLASGTNYYTEGFEAGAKEARRALRSALIGET